MVSQLISVAHVLGQYLSEVQPIEVSFGTLYKNGHVLLMREDFDKAVNTLELDVIKNETDSGIQQVATYMGITFTNWILKCTK